MWGREVVMWGRGVVMWGRGEGGGGTHSHCGAILAHTSCEDDVESMQQISSTEDH